jgi:hypothetical protein
MVGYQRLLILQQLIFGVAELWYDEVVLRASKITHIEKQYYEVPRM